MTKQWLLDHFPLRDTNQVAVFTEDNGEIVCDVDQLATMIGTATSYADLSALPIAVQGWQKVFDQWKQKGLVS